MDAYPEDYIVRNLPFILISGLEPAPEDDAKISDVAYPLLQERGPKIYSDFPPLTGSIAEELRRVLLEEDASSAPWDTSNKANATSQVAYRVKSIGRSYRLPPRKADPPLISPPMSPTAGEENDKHPVPSFNLHSPISPLSPSSPTFPDGLLTPLWVTKHQSLVPAAVINFFPFCVDPNMSSLRDNQLKIEINGLKQEWASSGYKTRFIVVLLSEEGDEDYIRDADDRVASIRRATNLDQKSIFLIPPDATAGELKEFTSSLLSLLQPSLMEYYRDLSKHARRKRNRSTIPPPTAPPTSGTSQTLSLQGWNVRYEFKMGIFAEFRQEIDAALRNYESAYETLFGQEVFENIAGWSPRFNDARLISDAIAIRIIRCLLQMNQTTAAVRAWVRHRSFSEGIVNRRGKGTRNYGWEAWEARWSMVMAQLVSQAQIPYFTSEGIPQEGFREQYSIFIPREKTTQPAEAIKPWEHLHHEGYWLYRSAKHAMQRRALAEQIPPEDRVPPGQSPASQIASKSYLYDTYLAPDTHIEAPQAGLAGFDHSSLIIGALTAALGEFSKRDQVRMTERLSLEIAEEYMRIGSWDEAHRILQPLWSTLSWRGSGWWDLMGKFGWALRECALRVKDSETMLRVDWEMLNRAFQPKPDCCYDIHKSLDELPFVEPKPCVVLKAEDTIPSVTAKFVFKSAEGNVGEPLSVQLILKSRAQPSSGPIKLSAVKVVFEGCLRPIKLQASNNIDSDTRTPCTISSISLQEPRMSADSSSLQSPTSHFETLTGIADLTIGPNQTKVFNLTCIPREAGESQIASVTLLVEEERFDLACAVNHFDSQNSFWWQETATGVTRRRVGKGRETTQCRIMPKPPKIQITTPTLKNTYYTNERIVLRIGIHNEEDEAADVVTETRLFGPPESAAKLSWLDEQDSAETQNSGTSTPIEGVAHFLKRPIGVMESSSQRDLEIILTSTDDASDYDLEISAVYNLVSDIHTPIIATVRVSVSIIRPFEANYEFHPRLHPSPWPDFFTIDDDVPENEKPRGLQQRWCLNSKTVSFALEPLVIEKVSLALVEINGGAICHIGSEEVASPATPEIRPEELRESNFTLDMQKLVLGDRRPTAVNLILEICWRRSESDPSSSTQITTTSLAVPRFVAPAGEPRVLASAAGSKNLSGLVHVDYTLENPSLHFLTFNLTMEASEHFAFSGPKTMVVQLVPLSRHTVRYNLLASRRGQWIQPQLLVVDTYFNKNLRVLPTEDMRSDKKGILVWVDADD